MSISYDEVYLSTERLRIEIIRLTQENEALKKENEALKSTPPPFPPEQKK